MKECIDCGQEETETVCEYDSYYVYECVCYFFFAYAH